MSALKVCLNTQYLDHPDFNAILIPLDATPKSDLKWEKAIEDAKKVIAKGKKIIFELDFGFERQTKLTEAHFLTLTLAIDRFNALFKEFESHIRGVCLLKTDLNFYELIEWDLDLIMELKKYLDPISFDSIEELLQNERLKFKLNVFASELISNLLNLLLTQFPSEIEAFILIQTEMKNITQIYQLLASKHFQNFSFAVQDLTIGEYQWNDLTFSNGYFLSKPKKLIEVEKAFIAFLVTETDAFLKYESFLQSFIEQLSKLGLVLKVIEDECLTQNWKGLEVVVGFKSLFSDTCQRQIDGFLAADGLFVNLENQTEVEQFLAKMKEKFSLKAAKLKELSKQKLSKHLPPSEQ